MAWAWALNSHLWWCCWERFLAAAKGLAACLETAEALVLDLIILADCISIYLVSDLRILSSVERVSSGLLEALIIAC